MVTVIQHIMVKALFLAGHRTVIIDATHITARRREVWLNPQGWNLHYHVIPTTKEECIRRATGDKREDLKSRPDDVEDILRGGAQRARAIAGPILDDVRRVSGIGLPR